MADKQQENGSGMEVLPQQSGNASVAAAPNSGQNSSDSQKKPAETGVNPAHKAEPVMSEGERKFNWITYKGLNYWTNLVMSVGVADYYINPLSKGRAKLNKWIESTANLASKAGASPDKARHHSRVGWETFMLLSGGTLLLIPLKLLEDNKRKIVHWLNDKLGVDQTAPDGHKKTPEEIHIEKEQPKQSVGNLVWRRVMGTVAVVGSGMTIDHFLRVNRGEKIQGGKERVTGAGFDLINKAVKAVRGKEFKENGVVGRWTKLAILDSMFTAITAIVMWATSGAKKGKMPQEIDDSDDPMVVKYDANRIITTADLSDKAFADRVEKRVKKLVETKHNNPSGLKKGFVEALQQSEAPTIGVGV